ncbi:MAG: MFS transporter [Anaerolineales bacterium]
MRVLYGLAAFLYWSALYLYVPTLPSYIQGKTASLALIGVITSQYGLWQAVFRLPLGILADWLGRRKVLIIFGFFLCGLGALILGLAEGVSSLMAGRAITGLAATTWVLLVVGFSNLFPQDKVVRASATLSIIASTGRVVATSLTGFLNRLGGFSLPFFLSTGLSGLAILVLLPTRERPVVSPSPSPKGILRLITRRDVLLPSLLAAVAQHANWAATFTFMPLLVQNLGGTDVTKSVLVSMHIAVLVFGHLATPKLEERVGPQPLIYSSFGLLFLGLGVAALAPALGWLFVAQFCIGLSMGVNYPILMGKSIENVSEGRRSTAMGLHQAVYAIGMFSGPGLSGLLSDAIGLQPMFAVTAAAILLPVLFITPRIPLQKQDL